MWTISQNCTDISQNWSSGQWSQEIPEQLCSRICIDPVVCVCMRVRVRVFCVCVWKIERN